MANLKALFDWLTKNKWYWVTEIESSLGSADGIFRVRAEMRLCSQVNVALDTTLETLDFTIRIGSTPTFLYFDLYLYSA